MDVRLLGLRISSIQDCVDDPNIFQVHKVDKENTSTCPICLQLISTEESKQNEHIDLCLALEIANDQSKQKSPKRAKSGGPLDKYFTTEKNK